MKAAETAIWLLLGLALATALFDHIARARRWWPDLATSAGLAAGVTICAAGAVGWLR